MKCHTLQPLLLLITLAVVGRDAADACYGPSAPWNSQLGFVISSRELADSRFSSSSHFNANYAAHRARLDKYFNYACSWSAKTGAVHPWVEVDLVTATTVVGIAIMKRCDLSSQYVKSYRVEALVDGIWNTVHVQMVPSYIGDFQFAYFENPRRARKWRVVVLSYNAHSSMKFDLIGYI